MQTIQQLPRMAQVVDLFGPARAGDRPLMQGWPPYATVPRANHRLDLKHFKNRDQLPQLVGQRTQRLFQLREQTTLNHTDKCIN